MKAAALLLTLALGMFAFVSFCIQVQAGAAPSYAVGYAFGSAMGAAIVGGLLLIVGGAVVSTIRGEL